jgi:hypothetical protein
MKMTGTSKPKARIMARVIRADGEIVDLGTICGEGRDEPGNAKKQADGRARLNRVFNGKLSKEERHG